VHVLPSPDVKVIIVYDIETGLARKIEVPIFENKNPSVEPLTFVHIHYQLQKQIQLLKMKYLSELAQLQQAQTDKKQESKTPETDRNLKGKQAPFDDILSDQA